MYIYSAMDSYTGGYKNEFTDLTWKDVVVLEISRKLAMDMLDSEGCQ